MVKATIYTSWDQDIPKALTKKFKKGFYIQQTDKTCVITLFVEEMSLREAVLEVREFAKDVQKLNYKEPVVIEWQNAEVETV